MPLERLELGCVCLGFFFFFFLFLLGGQCTINNPCDRMDQRGEVVVDEAFPSSDVVGEEHLLECSGEFC